MSSHLLPRLLPLLRRTCGVTDRGENFVAWQWDPVAGAAGYQVQVSVGDNSFSPPDEEAALASNQTAVRFEDEELAPGTSVYLRVRGVHPAPRAAPVYGQFTGAVSGMTAGARPRWTPTGSASWRSTRPPRGGLEERRELAQRPAA